MPVWWQRIPWVSLGTVLALGVPAYVGLRGLSLVIAALLLQFPTMVFAYVFVFTLMPPKYARQKQATLTLFRR